MRLALVCGVVVLGICGVVGAGEQVLVPRALEEVMNPRFRNALIARAPEYDGLDRSEQVRAYVGVYRSLNYGATPSLGRDDAYMAGMDTEYVPEGLVPATEPLVGVSPGIDSRERQTYVDGYGYKRLPPAGSGVFGGSVAAPAGREQWGEGLQVGEPGVTGQGAPSYAPPFVARPRRADKPHAGP